MYAQVIVDIVNSKLSRSFTYKIPNDMQISEGFRVEVPFGKKNLLGIVISVDADTDIDHDKIKEIVAIKEDYPAILPSMVKLAKQMAKETNATVASTLRLMLPSEMRRDKISVKQEAQYRLLVDKNYIDELIKKYISKKKGLILSILSDYTFHSIKEICEYVTSPYQVLSKMIEDGLIEKVNKEVFRLPYEKIDEESCEPELTIQQQTALDIIDEERLKGSNAFLIHGVTGSGKTEVYIRLVKKAIREGKGVIILVPEISLTPQMVRWFRERFSDSAAVLHSRLSAGEKYDEWRRIRLGCARVVIGARSAIFAPVENLGLIVIDEEHETTYQSDKHPRYDARHIAELRAKNESCYYVLASATPNIKSFAMALKNKYTLVEMPNRVMNRPMPEVTVVDMRKELSSGNLSMISTLLYEKIKYVIETGNQCILFLNRRGYSTFVSCRNCGHVIKCENCDISMTYHMNSSTQMLKCHLCGAQRNMPDKCPNCSSSHVKFFGGGTQKVEDEVKKLFPEVKVLRMDQDTTQTKNAHEKILEEFRENKAQILIGTQMITKGLDFPNVTLVGVIAADTTLFLPDYRAPERTFQLLTQVSGRAGRSYSKGEVIIQTYNPDNQIIIDSAKQDYRAFFTKELNRRRKSLYPPFTQIGLVLVEAVEKEVAFSMCLSIYNSVKDYLNKNEDAKKSILTFYMDEAPIKRIKGLFRYRILLKMLVNDSIEKLKEFITKQTLAEYEDINVAFEIDPINMM